jgi:hypothetical protein
MNIALADKSSYLRGLLILARKDNNISKIQKTIILKAGKQLGFSSEFCEEILDTLLYNECLCLEPIKFNSCAVAQSFVADGLKLTCSGKSIMDEELEWLWKAAEINSVDLKWFNEQVKNYSCLINTQVPTQLTLHSII